MGIDPVTHKPLPEQQQIQNNTQPSQINHVHIQQQQNQQHVTSVLKIDQNGEPEKADTSYELSSTLNESKEDDKIIENQPFEDIMIDSFCTDEVPLIEPDEILMPSGPTPSSSSSSSSSSSNSSDFLRDLELPEFEWACNYSDNDINNDNNSVMGLWGDDDFMNGWDLLLNDDNDDVDRKVADFDSTIKQCPRMVMDQESWAYDLF